MLRTLNALIECSCHIALLTPLVTIITLAATLIAQNWQFLRSESDKREDAQDAQWQDAIKQISSSGALSPAVVTLQPFLQSTKYGEQDRDIAVNLLANSSDSTFFTSLFGSALTPVTSSLNVNRMVNLDRALRPRLDPLFSKSWDEKIQTNVVRRLSQKETTTYDYGLAVMPVIASQIAGALRTRSTALPMDLSGTYLYDADLGKIDFSGVDLTSVEMTGCDLKDAELKGATQFRGATLFVGDFVFGA